MKNICAVLLLITSLAFAQTTPNLGLNIPSPGAEVDWGLLLNNNSLLLDSFLSGGAPLPVNLGLNGYMFVKEIATPSDPGSGYELWYANSSTHLISCLTHSGSSCLTASAAGSTGNLQGNCGGALCAVPGTTLDFTNGLLAIAPTGTGTALTVTGDTASDPIACLDTNSSHATPGYLCFQIYADGSIFMHFYDQSTTGSTTFGPTGMSMYGAGISVNVGTIATGTAGSFVSDSAGDDIMHWSNQSGLVAKITSLGALSLNLPVAASSTPTIASASTIAPTSSLTHISGTVTISTITPPYSGFLGCLNLIPTGLWTTTISGGNIALASTAVVNKVLTMCYDGSDWYPSY